jgi:hypothetical protein
VHLGQELVMHVVHVAGELLQLTFGDLHGVVRLRPHSTAPSSAGRDLSVL